MVPLVRPIANLLGVSPHRLILVSVVRAGWPSNLRPQPTQKPHVRLLEGAW